MNILIAYFSATGNTGKIAKVIGETLSRLGCHVAMSDITAFGSRQKRLDLTPYQAVVFGAPIHSWRAPKVVREWMQTLDGQGKKCAMFFTYGGFGVHPTHYSTKRILDDRNFSVVSSAEFLAPHTFNIGGWKAMEGRPDETDYETAKEFAGITLKRFTGEDNAILGELEKTGYTEEQLDSIESFRFKVLTQLPTRDGKECSLCMVCEESCPTGAIHAESDSVDKDKCIACLACVANCPEDALRINDMSESWSFKLAMEKTTADAMKAIKSKIYL